MSVSPVPMDLAGSKLSSLHRGYLLLPHVSLVAHHNAVQTFVPNAHISIGPWEVVEPLETLPPLDVE